MKLHQQTAAILTFVLVANSSIVATAQDPESLRLADGTRIPIRLVEQITSATAKNGDPVAFEVIEDVIVNGVVVIKQGTPVRGAIVEAAAKRRMGRAGKLSYTVTETRSIAREPIRLRATQEQSGGSNVAATAVTTTAVAVFVPVAAPFFLLRKGKDVTIAPGTRVEAFVQGEHLVRLAESGGTSTATVPIKQGAISATRQDVEVVTTRMTNADILSLYKAGFGDELIMSKIQASETSFVLGTSELVSLKNAGVSERVIKAMLDAKQ